METALAILMVLGIFVGVPAIIGFIIVGGYKLATRRVKPAKEAKTATKHEPEELAYKPAKA